MIMAKHTIDHCPPEVGKPYAFKIDSGEGIPLYVAADTEELSNRWIKLLKQAATQGTPWLDNRWVNNFLANYNSKLPRNSNLVFVFFLFVVQLFISPLFLHGTFFGCLQRTQSLPTAVQHYTPGLFRLPVEIGLPLVWLVEALLCAKGCLFVFLSGC